MRSFFQISSSILALLVASATTAAEPMQRLRDQAVVRVQGADETWQLVWDDRPVPVCSAAEVSTAVTCPCSGFAYEEAGKLSLVRRRDGRDIERMDLGPLFADAEHPFVDFKTNDADMKDAAYLRRWPMDADDLRRDNSGDPALAAEIARRPQSKVIQPADYDQDGNATEFLVEVGTLPCGKNQFVAVGLSASRPGLHALASAAKPDVPLFLPLRAWQALQKGGGNVETWVCGDHGSDTRSEVAVTVNTGEIRIKRRTFSCPEGGSAEKLIEETDQ